jgi:hypothetical protein
VAAFPVLKTGAVAQYPAEQTVRFATVVQEFVDGSQQRFRQRGASLRRWVIRLEQLDDAELFALEQFFEEQAGVAGVFSFTDPWDGGVHPNCSLESDEIALRLGDIGQGQTVLVVKENG